VRDALEAIRDGDLSQTRLARLSDLSREGARDLVAAWPTIPETTRITLVRRCEELSEERVELNFNRALRVALDDPSTVVRQYAIAALWEDESPDLLDRLRSILVSDDSPDVRAAAAAALERFATAAANGALDSGEESALRRDLLHAATDAASPYTVKRRALESLGPLAQDNKISSLIADSYDSDDHGLQCSAVYAMGRSLDPRWLPVLMDELESEEPELRYEAARAAGQLGSSDALVGLLNAAHDEDAEVRHAAISAIGQIGGRGALRALERLAEEAGEADLELIEAVADDVNALIEPISSES
jgi:HEAT repeat protein